MATKDLRPIRDQTDESLASERANADRALQEKVAANERRADQVLANAREDADQVLSEARESADSKLSDPESSAKTQAVLEEERKREDEAVRRERAVADQVLMRERAVTLARLFPLERDQTDLYLLTERARSDEALDNRDDFLGMVTHDLRDLLNGIAMSAVAIGDEATGEAGKPTLVGVQRIQRAAGRMNRLIGDLIDIAAIDAGKLAIVPSPTDAAEVVAEAVDTWGPPTAAKSIRLDIVPAIGAVTATLDHQRILQVLGNLITNAAKFSPRGSSIECGVGATEDGGVRFFVRDDGVGIEADKLLPIFERFWQVGGNDRRGLGLGLYISRCIVEAHGGTIWAESEPGHGSTFYFAIPGSRGQAPGP